MPGELFLGIASVLSIPLAWPLGRYVSSAAITVTEDGGQADAIREGQKLFPVIFPGIIIAYEIISQENSVLKYISVPLITFLASYSYFGISRAVRKFKQDD